jgi:hypothetical protein
MDLAWLDQVISHRFDPNSAQLPLPAPPAFQDRSDDPYAEMVHALRLEPAERLVLILALAPHLAPERLDPFLLKNEATGRCFSEFGGMAGQSHTGFLPTAETALFLLAGRDLAQRLIERPRLLAGSALHRNGLIELDLRHPEEPPLSAMLRPGPAWLERLLSGSEADPPPGPGFPAVRVTTTLDWADLVLDDITMEQVELIRTWISHADTLLSDPELARRLKPGYRCLFHGPPGTGKTLTASLLGKAHGLPVYRVDLSRVVSKWIGDTEKNLAALFDHAQHRNWILFFDEAESLFGQRTESRSANDRSANQQISYLLQRLEDYPGLTILATNNRSYMDEAFTRRFQSTIRFPFPGPAARRRLWEESFRSPRFTLDRDVDFTALAEKYELAGGSIINVLRHVCLLAVQRTPPIIHATDLAQGIREEMQKEGRFSK